MDSLSQVQIDALQAAQKDFVFLKGPAGTGKTSTALQQIINLIERGIPANQILILVPQRTLAKSYYDLLQSPEFPSGSIPTIVTMGGLARRMIALFWPLVRVNSFSKNCTPPVFLTLETAQYYLAQVADSIIDSSGYFTSLRIKRNRIYSQILDNLNKAALIDFPLENFAEKLTVAWNGESGHVIIYKQVQEIALKFREYCFQHNLLDFSLQMEIFHRFLAKQPIVQTYLNSSFSHLIYDNVEEDAPSSHDLVESWLPQFRSAMFIMDSNAGYRTFLGADPISAERFQPECKNILSFEHSYQSSEQVQRFSSALTDCIDRRSPEITSSIAEAYSVETFRLAPESNQAVVQKITALLEDGVQPAEIAVLTPFLNDTTRFTLAEALHKQNIRTRTFRPSRPLNSESAFICLLTLARLAHPHWNLPVNSFELRNALVVAIEGMDMVRAAILSKTVIKKTGDGSQLSSFDTITNPDRLEQITYLLGERYEQLRLWLETYHLGSPEPLDVFVSRIFGEVLSQPGFRFHQRIDYASVCARLAESIQKFRQVVAIAGTYSGNDSNQEYVEMVSKGLLAAQYLEQTDKEENAVLIAPAFTFLMTNQPVSYQFWLDIGSISWSERLEQPLTHPYVLSRNWEPGEKWTNAWENRVSQETLERIVLGLAALCRNKIFLYASGISEQGQEQSSPFLKAMQRLNLLVFQSQESQDA